MKTDKLGWIVAAALAGAFLGMGLQPAAPKFATVDMPKVFDQADLTKSGTAEFQAFYTKRFNVLQFLRQNPPMLPDDAKKYAELAVKDQPTAADQTELNRIEADAKAVTQKQEALVQKSAPTEDEKTQMEAYRQRVQQNRELQDQLAQKYQNDADATKQRLHDQAMDRVRQAVEDLGKSKGYTVIFSAEAAPYAANDLTDDAVKAVGGKSK